MEAEDQQPTPMEDPMEQLDLKHADSNNSIPPPPPPMPLPPVARVESDELPDPDGDSVQHLQHEENQHTPVDEHYHHQQPVLHETEHVQEREQFVQHGEFPPHGGEGGDQEKLAVSDEKEQHEHEARGDNCCEKILRCLSFVPCGSLIAWIVLLLGLGALTGSLLIGAQKTRDLLDDDELLWFIEFSVTGVVVSMFVLGTCFLVAGHLSTDPTSRRIFNSTSKNRCARGFNIFLLVFVYILCLCWVLLCMLLATPIVLLVLMYLVTGRYEEGDCFDLQHYGFPEKQFCGTDLNRFKEHAQDILICYSVALFAALLVVISLVHFLICVSANITHLRDNRFATLNAYETEEVRNSKHSVLDTNM